MGSRIKVILSFVGGVAAASLIMLVFFRLEHWNSKIAIAWLVGWLVIIGAIMFWGREA